MTLNHFFCFEWNPPPTPHHLFINSNKRFTMIIVDSSFFPFFFSFLRSLLQCACAQRNMFKIAVRPQSRQSLSALLYAPPTSLSTSKPESPSRQSGVDHSAIEGFEWGGNVDEMVGRCRAGDEGKGTNSVTSIFLHYLNFSLSFRFIVLCTL